MVFRVFRAIRHLPIRPLTAAGLLFALAWLTGRVDRWALFTERTLWAGWLLTAASLAWWVLRWLAPALSTKRWVDRRDDAALHAGGVATWTDIGELASPSQLRSRLVELRPSLGRVSWWRRRRTALTAVGVPLVRTSPARVNTAWSPCDEVTLRVGGPRSGKSASLACHALDAPGALLVTTSRTDLLDDTGAQRARHGRVLVFNPTGLGTDPAGTPGASLPASVGDGVGEPVRWSPLAGCQDYGTATRRAADLIPDSGSSSDGERWDEQARGLLATLLHAAALSGGRMQAVLGWISPADTMARDDILAALAANPAARPMAAQVRSLYGTNDRTLSSITATLLPRLRWVLDPALAASGDAALDDPAFLDVAAFVARGRDSLYLIGRDGGAPTLIGALTAEVAHQVRQHAARMPRGRLDPPATAVLDEAPITCGPVPLHQWTADMGGFNFTCHVGAQSLAQLRDVWGRERAAAILGNVGSLVVFGGIKNDDDLHHISTLTGTRLVQVDPDDARPLPVMTPAEIAALPRGTALVIRNGMRPIVGRAPWIGQRRPSRLARTLAAAWAWLAGPLRTLVAGIATRRAQAWAARTATVPARTRGTVGTSSVTVPTAVPSDRDGLVDPLQPFTELELVARPDADEAIGDLLDDLDDLEAGRASASPGTTQPWADDSDSADGSGGVA